jgi:hypothetical protein
MHHTSRITAALALLVTLALNPAAADENPADDAAKAAQTETAANNRALAREANEQAAAKAIEAVLAETRLDLDIRLIGPTSIKIASDR